MGFGEALNTLEQVRGRVETQALEHHETQPVHLPTTEEAELTRLNIALINTEDRRSDRRCQRDLHDRAAYESKRFSQVDNRPSGTSVHAAARSISQCSGN